jgi:hypothetical protein
VELRKNKNKRCKTILEGWIYVCENLVTMMQSGRINNLRYRVPRNILKMEGGGSHENPVHFYHIRSSHMVEGGNIYSRLRHRISR